MLPTTITTSELRRLTNFSAAALVDFAQRGIIRRAGKNRWAMPDTMVRLVAHLRDRHAH